MACSESRGGETRRLGLNTLMEEGRSAAGVPVTSEFPVPVKVVDEDKARAISYAENGQRYNLFPADQLANFHELAEEGIRRDESVDTGADKHRIDSCRPAISLRLVLRKRE